MFQVSLLTKNECITYRAGGKCDKENGMKISKAVYVVLQHDSLKADNKSKATVIS